MGSVRTKSIHRTFPGTVLAAGAGAQVMMRELIFLPEVSHDLAEAFNYYENLSPERGGARFENVFKQTLAQLEEGFATHARAFEHFHRIILRPYPYNV